MQEKLFAWVQIGVLAVVTVAVGGVILIMFPPINSEVAAAWVQALGSILAIIGAYVIGERQANTALANSLKLNAIANQKKNESIMAIAAAAKKLAEDTKEAGADPYLLSRAYKQRIATGIIKAIEVVPLHELGSYAAVAALLELKNLLIELNEYVDFVFRSPQGVAYRTGNPLNGIPIDLTLVSHSITSHSSRIIKRYEDLASALKHLND